LIGFFSVFHGHALGTELPVGRSILHSFGAEVLTDNKPILQFLEQMGFVIEQQAEAGMI
jgi:hydrogenase/urease accessory protein HupE